MKNSVNSLTNDIEANPQSLSIRGNNNILSQNSFSKRSSMSSSRLGSYGNSIMNLDGTIKKSLIDFNKSCISNEDIKNEEEKTNKTKAGDNLTQKLRPLICGLTLYKKFNNNQFNSNRKEFDPFKEGNNNPEECGYGKRVFKFNTQTLNLEIRTLNEKNSHFCESKFHVYELKDIFLGVQGKKIVKAKEGHLNLGYNKSSELLSKNDFINFTLILIDQKIDLIAPNYLTFTSFECAIKEIIKNISYLTEIIKQLKL